MLYIDVVEQLELEKICFKVHLDVLMEAEAASVNIVMASSYQPLPARYSGGAPPSVIKSIYIRWVITKMITYRWAILAFTSIHRCAPDTSG